ncbi:MAG: ABC transporter substrate-binding protein [Bacillota bacterium]
MKKSKLVRVVLIVLSLILVISMAACAKKEIPAAADPTPTQETEKKIELAQGVTDTEIKIGTIAVQAGVLSFIGQPYVSGMKAYFDMVNEAGGINGRKITLIAEDDEFKPDKSIAAAEKLIEQDKVFAIVGQLGTPCVLATADTVKEAGIPSVYFGSGAVAMTKLGDNFFPVQPDYESEGKLMAYYVANEVKASKIAVLYQNDDVGKEGLTGIKEGLKALGKEAILGEAAEIAFGAADKDFTAQIQKAKAENPDFVIIYGLSGGTAGLLKEIEKVEFDVPLLTTYSNADASFLAIAAAGAPKMTANLHVMGWLEVEQDKLKPLLDAMAKYYKDVPVNAYTMAGWVAAETFVAGLKQAGDNLSWEGYIDAMNKLDFKDGLAPHIKYAPGVRQGVQKMAVSKAVMKDGAYIFEQLTDFFEFHSK